jgi:xylulose-5-phosphate/fructose-6-phosphate phosphoketolase
MMKNSTIKKDYSPVKKYLRLANYISAAQLYLKDNFFLERELRSDDIKNRLLGHWGGATGVNFVLAHLNFYLKENQK